MVTPILTILTAETGSQCSHQGFILAVTGSQALHCDSSPDLLCVLETIEAKVKFLHYGHGVTDVFKVQSRGQS